MKLIKALSFLPVMVLLAAGVAAQENLPPSYLEFLEMRNHSAQLTPAEISQLASRAQAGASEAQYKLALLYEGGSPLTKDAAAAQRWMLKSAGQGYAPAERGMGRLYMSLLENGVADHGEAERWFQMAAVQGDAEAQFWLGLGCQAGSLGSLDYVDALGWLHESATQGFPLAQFELGQMYAIGHGVPINNQKAAYWFHRAADHNWDVDGVFSAVSWLEEMYRDGRLHDDAEAYLWHTVIDSLIDPPVNPAEDDVLKELANGMTPAQVNEARLKAADWIVRHPRLDSSLALSR
jgi:TPR repeat protein